MDLITIGITCFDAQDSISRAVASAGAQDWPELEIVVVDDCSTDGSRQILECLSSEERRMRVVAHAENRGVGAARNTLLEIARGDFVAFFDDDDISDPGRLTAQYNRITGYERDTGTDLVVCHTATRQRYPDGTARYSSTLGMDTTPAPRGDDVARLILTGRPVPGGPGACPTCSLMARREVFERVGGFDASLRRHEDTDFNLRFALAGGHFAGLSEPLVDQTMTFAGEKTAAEERRYALHMLEKHRDVLDGWDGYEFARRWTEMKFAMIEAGTARALPGFFGLLLRSPVKTLRRAAWSLPNRSSYKRYDFPHE